MTQSPPIDSRLHGSDPTGPDEVRLFPAAIFYIGMHLACLSVFWVGITWRGLAIFAASYFFRVFWMGISLHRYFAHRSFRTSRPMQLALAILGMLGMQRGVLWWAQTHRYHHQHADTPEDLHSPHYQGFWYSHCMWFFNVKHRETAYSQIPDLVKYPELVWLDGPVTSSLPGVAYGLAMWWLLGWEGLVWGFVVTNIALWHVVHFIQSVSHSLGGYRRFATKDDSRNHWLFAVLALGEFHNNHHYAPWSARQGLLWWEIDVVYYGLKVMSWLGLVWDLKTPVLDPAPAPAQPGG